jgi:luciferase family oxidoreductase group 1
MLSLPLSVLDISMIEQGRSNADALRATVELARRAEMLGYRRFWVAEHHNSPASASPAPAILVAQIAATTSRISVGSGGVMLTNHAPLAVAEQFAVLHALHPGRIDLGVGRGAGTFDTNVVMALRRGAPAADAEDYARSVEEMLDFVRPSDATSDDSAGVWLLASSGKGARLAGQLGLPLVVAHHSRPDDTYESVERYRENFRPSRWLNQPYVMVSILTICANSQEQADVLARPAFRFFAEIAAGRAHGGFASVAEMAVGDLTEEELTAAGRLRRTQAIGDPDAVTTRLAEIADATAADELMLMTPVWDIGDRLRSLGLAMAGTRASV